jgi:hypothetical protein
MEVHYNDITLVKIFCGGNQHERQLVVQVHLQTLRFPAILLHTSAVIFVYEICRSINKTLKFCSFLVLNFEIRPSKAKRLKCGHPYPAMLGAFEVDIV